MKAIYEVLVEKLKEVEANYVSLGIGVFGLATLAVAGGIVNNLIDSIVEIAQVIAGQAAG